MAGVQLLPVASQEDLDRVERNAVAATDTLRAAIQRLEREAVGMGEELNVSIQLLGDREREDVSQLSERIDALSWWVRGLALVVSMLVIALCCALTTGCAGEPFEAEQAPGVVAPAGDGGSGGAADAPSAGGAGEGGAPSSGAPGGAGGAGDGPPAAVACPRLGWMVEASSSFTDGYGGPPALALDGDPATRWTTGKPQAPGQWFEVAFPEPTALVSLEVASIQFPGDAPARLVLALDGVPAPASVRVVRPGTLEVTPERPQLVSRARLELVEPSALWWSIDELTGRCE
jgi:hypothetical protein